MSEEILTADQIRKQWLIRTKQIGGRWTWMVEYPISRYALVPTKSFASHAAASRDAFRVIRLLKSKTP